MKKSFLSLLAIGALCLTGCSDEVITENGGGVSAPNLAAEGYAYINAEIALPSANGGAYIRSRSETDEPTGEGDDLTNSDGKTTPDSSAEPDYEYGYAVENDVRSMILVFATEDNGYITHAYLTGMSASSEIGKAYAFNAKAKIPYSVLEELYTTGAFKDISNEPKIHLFAYCNPPQDLVDQFSTLIPNSLESDWLDFSGKVEEAASMAGQSPQSTSTIWSDRSFLMTNSSIYKTTFPQTLAEWDQYADDSKPYKLTNNPLDVERACARLDFRDASDKGDQVYRILLDISTTENPTQAADTDNSKLLNFYNVQLTRMVLVNMSKDYYYLRRVSTDGFNTGATIGGRETPANYVVDYAAEQKSAGLTNTTAGQYFNFPLFDEEMTEKPISYNNIGDLYGWYISNISDVLAGKEDNWSSETYKKQYHIWRYVTENTLPSIDSQQVQQSTGIIFKAAIQIGDDKDKTFANGERYISQNVIDALNNVEENHTEQPALFMYNNLMYAGHEDLIPAARRDGEGGSLFNAVHNMLRNWYIVGDETAFKYHSTRPSGNNVVALSVVIADEIITGQAPTDGSKDYSTGYTIDFRTSDVEGDTETNTDKAYDDNMLIKLAASTGITTFVPTNDDSEKWGYYCYYFYWIRHNDNHLNGKMGTMEFATVRNNVYKLAVTKINGIGHPRDINRDPDPVQPGDPDEDPMRSIEVEINVLPWVVRIDDIEF